MNLLGAYCRRHFWPDVKATCSQQIGQGRFLSIVLTNVAAVPSSILTRVSVTVQPLLAFSPTRSVIGKPLSVAIGYSGKFSPSTRSSWIFCTSRGPSRSPSLRDTIEELPLVV